MYQLPSRPWNYSLANDMATDCNACSSFFFMPVDCGQSTPPTHWLWACSRVCLSLTGKKRLCVSCSLLLDAWPLPMKRHPGSCFSLLDPRMIGWRTDLCPILQLTNVHEWEKYCYCSHWAAGAVCFLAKMMDVNWKCNLLSGCEGWTIMCIFAPPLFSFFLPGEVGTMTRAANAFLQPWGWNLEDRSHPLRDHQ